jgi:ADP-heptose:LPS heptosyltransferase
MATCSSWSATAGAQNSSALTRPATLAIHPGALGDVLQAVPALRALRRRGPLTFAAQPRLGRLLHGLDVVDAVLSFDGLGFEALFTVDLAPPALTTRLQAFSRVISWFGARDPVYRERLGSLARQCAIASPLPDDTSRLTAWRHLLATIDAESCTDLQPVDVPRIWRDEAIRALTELGARPNRPLLVVHPGAGSQWKLWPAEHQARVLEPVIRDTGAQAVIHQGPADREIAERLWRLLGGRAPRLIEPELPLLAGVLAQASAYLGGDSGVSHLAATVGAPAVIVFPLETRERWAPWSPTARRLSLSAEPDQVTAVLCERMREVRREAG